MRASGLAVIAVLLATGTSFAAPVRLAIHNPLALERKAAAVEVPTSLLPRGIHGEWVAVSNGQITPLQFEKNARTAITVLDLPANSEVSLLLRPRTETDPAPADVARATIPIKDGDKYREVRKFVVPKTHVIHDPLFPIEGAGWESGRVGYRVYLDTRNATDVFGKKLPAPVLHTIGQSTASYHEEGVWGMDVWHVGDSLGGGGLGVLRKGMATQIGDPKRIVATVESSGPVLAGLRVEDNGFTYKGHARNLMVRYSIAAGSRLSMNTAAATPGTPLVAGFGKYPSSVFIQSQNDARSGWGYIATWGRQSENGKDDIGVALFYPLKEVVRTGDDGRSYFIVFKNPAKARYAFAAAWAREGGGIPDEAGFRAYIDRTATELSHPVFVTAERK